MKLIHTADWHIGQSFYDYDRKIEHVLFFQWLQSQIKEYAVDLLLIAGDIFDSPNPSAESQSMFYRFLKETTTDNPQLQIIVIAGNHDSAARLEAPIPLLEDTHISIRGTVKRNEDGTIDFAHLIIPLLQGGYCLAVPFLRQGDYPENTHYGKGIQSMYEELYKRVKDLEGPIIALGHLQTTGSHLSENDRSERTIIGGIECVSSNAFDAGISYTALGHLHREQQIAHRENVRYSGSPLPMSFAEKNNKQGVTLVHINTHTTEIQRLKFDAPVKLISIPPSPLPLDKVLDEIALLSDGERNNTSPFLEIKVLITAPEPSLRHQIETALQGKNIRLARITSTVPSSNIHTQEIPTFESFQNLNPMDLATVFFNKRYGGEEMPTEMKKLLQNVIHNIES